MRSQAMLWVLVPGLLMLIWFVAISRKPSLQAAGQARFGLWRLLLPTLALVLLVAALPLLPRLHGFYQPRAFVAPAARVAPAAQLGSLDPAVWRALGAALAVCVLALVLFVAMSRQRVREAAKASGQGIPRLREMPWVWVVGAMVIVVATPLLALRYEHWTLSRHPPMLEHRQELVQSASRLLPCPADEITFRAWGEAGVEVTGCARTIRMCWQKYGRSSPYAWNYCYPP